MNECSTEQRPEALLRIKRVTERTGCSISKIYRMMAAGRFPEPLKLDGCSLWPASEVDAWITEQKAALPRGRAELR